MEDPFGGRKHEWIKPLDIPKYGLLALYGVAKAIIHRYPDRPFATHGNHFQHPLDTPVEPVVDWPAFDSEGSYHHLEAEA